MEYVNPIKDVEKIKAMKEYLANHSKRDLLLFVLGINTGISISDLLHLTIKDVVTNGQIHDFLVIRDEKCGEEKQYYLNDSVKSVLEDYLKALEFEETDYLFKSKKNNLPITRQQAYRIINQAAKEVGIEGRIGTHTLRKTFGYHAYRKGVAISILMHILNHTSASETLKYLGIENKKMPIMVDVNL